MTTEAVGPASTKDGAHSSQEGVATGIAADGAVAKVKKEKKAPPPDLVIQKKPQLTKAERRALQEQQRAAKAGKQQQQKGGQQQQQQQKPPSNSKPAQPHQTQQQQQQASGSNQSTKDSQKEKENVKGGRNDKNRRNDDNTISLFSHLPPYREMPNPYAHEWTSSLHPDVIDLGLKYASGEIHGDNARCRSMLNVFLNVLRDYYPPTHDASLDYRSHFDHQVLKPSFQFWTAECRPHCVAMGNAFTFLKAAVASLNRDLALSEAKDVLQDTIERYLQERLDYADQAIAQHALEKLQDGDVVLTFGHTEVISVLLTTARKRKVDFYVWVVDARPLWEGKLLLEELQAAGIPCGYIQLNALTYVMQQVTKVFLGCSSLLSNGSIYGRAGTACVALAAKDHHIPLLVCCETYKISNKVQLESITQNELGNPDALLTTNGGGGTATSPLAGWRDTPNLKLLNLLYDVTPSEFVSGIVTELGIVPPTSVAVLLREMNPQDGAYM